MKMSDLTRQQAKARACKIAAQRGFCLIRRGDHEVWEIHPNGKEQFLVRSDTSALLWHATLEMLEYRQSLRPHLSARKRWFWSFVHNSLIHPVMPFVWGRAARVLDELHDMTADLAFHSNNEGDKDE